MSHATTKSMANHWLRRQSARPEPRSNMFTQKGMVVTEATKVDVGRVLPRKSGKTAELEVTEGKQQFSFDALVLLAQIGISS